jgi:hypothetical protein
MRGKLSREKAIKGPDPCRCGIEFCTFAVFLAGREYANIVARRLGWCELFMAVHGKAGSLERSHIWKQSRCNSPKRAPSS